MRWATVLRGVEPGKLDKGSLETPLIIQTHTRNQCSNYVSALSLCACKGLAFCWARGQRCQIASSAPTPLFASQGIASLVMPSCSAFRSACMHVLPSAFSALLLWTLFSAQGLFAATLVVVKTSPSNKQKETLPCCPPSLHHALLDV